MELMRGPTFCREVEERMEGWGLGMPIFCCCGKRLQHWNLARSVKMQVLHLRRALPHLNNDFKVTDIFTEA